MSKKQFVSKFGDWTRAGVILQALSTKIVPAYQAQLQSDGELVLERIKGHIINQDLDWIPLSPHTVALKGKDTIYIETGFLLDNLKVRKVRSPKNGVTFFIGADAWTTHQPSGEKFSDLMIYLEYGTAKIPPRPVIRPTFEEVEQVLKDNWKQCLQDLIQNGG